MRLSGALIPVLGLAVSLAGSPLAAQRRELTFLMGANLTGATGPKLFKSASRSGFLGGVSLRMPRSARVSFETELLLVQHRLSGARAPSTAPPVTVGPLSDAPNLLYVQIPMLLRFQQGYSSERPVRPFLQLGPYLGIRLFCRRDLTEASGTMVRSDCGTSRGVGPASPDPFVPAIYQGLDVGLLGGFGVEVRRLAVSIRAERSFRNLVEGGALPTSPFDLSKTWTGLVAVEYLLRVL
jgi:hypothetical protein